MESAFKLAVPLGVEVRAGANWEEMKANVDVETMIQKLME